jgi:hypothetical protein
MNEHDMVWLQLAKEHQRRANVCSAKHRELVAAGAYGPTVRVRLLLPGEYVMAGERTDNDAVGVLMDADQEGRT